MFYNSKKRNNYNGFSKNYIYREYQPINIIRRKLFQKGYKLNIQTVCFDRQHFKFTLPSKLQVTTNVIPYPELNEFKSVTIFSFFWFNRTIKIRLYELT